VGKPNEGFIGKKRKSPAAGFILFLCLELKRGTEWDEPSSSGTKERRGTIAREIGMLVFARAGVTA